MHTFVATDFVQLRSAVLMDAISFTFTVNLFEIMMSTLICFMDHAYETGSFVMGIEHLQTYMGSFLVWHMCLASDYTKAKGR